MPVGRARIAVTASGLSAALGLLPGADVARAQDEGVRPAPPAPGAPRVVIAPRDLRMNLARVIPVRIGCQGTAGFCGGRLEAHLTEPIVAPARRGSRARRTYQPFLLGRAGFGVAAGRSQIVRMRLFPRAGYLVRLAGSIPVTIAGRPTSGAHPGEQAIHVYVSPLQAFR